MGRECEVCKKTLSTGNRIVRHGLAKAKGGIVSSLLPRMPQGARKTAGGSGPAKQVWVLRDGAAVAVNVNAGISDGRMTEVSDTELRAGMLVITDQRASAAAP